MSDELNENLNSQQVEEPVQETETVEDPEILKAEIAELKEKNKQLYARVKKEPLKTNQSSSPSDERFERQDLRIDGYSGDEVDFIMRNGGKQALDDKLVTAAIETMRAKAKSQDATPSGTGKSYTYQKFGERDLKKMSAEELEKIIPQD